MLRARYDTYPTSGRIQNLRLAERTVCPFLMCEIRPRIGALRVHEGAYQHPAHRARRSQSLWSHRTLEKGLLETWMIARANWKIDGEMFSARARFRKVTPLLDPQPQCRSTTMSTSPTPTWSVPPVSYPCIMADPRCRCAASAGTSRSLGDGGPRSLSLGCRSWTRRRRRRVHTPFAGTASSAPSTTPRSAP